MTIESARVSASTSHRRWPILLAVLFIIVAVSWVMSPSLKGFWGRDDFAVLSLVRMIGSPIAFFTQDAYPIPQAVFRPLGFFSMWLSERAFGLSYPANAAFDIALHALVALSLFALLMRLQLPAMFAAIGAALFGLHPVSIGPAMWWSARFDLLATLFVVIAVIAALAYRDRPRTSVLVLSLAACLAAMLSKEIGIVAVVAVSVVWMRRRAAVATALAWITLALFFVWRWCVIGTLSSGLTGPIGIASATITGVTNWLMQMPGYISFAPHLRVLQAVLLMIAAIGFISAAWIASRREDSINAPQNADALWIGLVFFLFPVALQAPIQAFAAPLTHAMSALEAGMQSRIYYLEMVGIAMLVAAAASKCFATRSLARTIGVASLGLLVATYAWVARHDASSFAKRAMAISDVARAADKAVADAAIPSGECHLVFLNYRPAPEWSVFVPMDSIVKGLSADTSRVAHCWVHSEMSTGIYYLRGGSSAEGFPSRDVGDITFVYGEKDSRRLRSLPNARFFAFDNRHFDDVTNTVSPGEWKNLP